MNIAGMDKAQILKALYNASKVAPPAEYSNFIGFSGFSGPMQDWMAADLLDVWTKDSKGYFSILNGHPLFIDLSGNALDTAKYNQHNGEGAAEAAIACGMTTGESNGAR